MKNLKKALATVVALSMMCVSVSAFADVEGTCTFSNNSNVTGTYNEANNSVTATVAEAQDDSQMTFIMFDKDVLGLTVENQSESYDVDADDILCIDQKTFEDGETNAFTGVINPGRITDSSGVMVAGNYHVRVGYYDDQGDFVIARGVLALTDKVADEITGIAFTNGTDSINATIGTGVDLGAQVTGTGNFESGYSIAIKDGTNSISATLDSNDHLDAGQIGSVTVVATATGDANITAELVVNFAAPTNGLTSVSASADYVEVTTGTTVNLSSTVADPTSGATVSWAKTSGDLAATATLVDNGNGTATITSSTAGSVTLTVTATTSYRTETDTIEITFKAPETPPPPTVTVTWGDIDFKNGAKLSDTVSIVGALSGVKNTWTVEKNEKTYIFTFNNSTVLVDSVPYTMQFAGSDLKWGDVDFKNDAKLSDTVSIVGALSGVKNTWTKNESLAQFDEDLVITLIAQ